MIKNPHDLLNKEIMQTVFLKFASRLNLSDDFYIEKIERFLAVAAESYILLYYLNDNGATKLIRGNASTAVSRLNAWEVMQILRQNSFSRDNYLIPRFAVFESDYNLLLYENIEGVVLINEMASNLQTLKVKIALAAGWLAKLHRLEYAVNLPKYQFQFNQEALARYYPDLAQNLAKIHKEALSHLQYDRRLLIHSDFQPNNMIIKDNHIWVFDFNDSVCDNPMIDVASFIAQLRTMLLRFGNPDHFAVLEQEFIKEYQKNCPFTNILNNDLQIYKKLFYLKILASLSASLKDNEPNKKEILAKIYQYWRQEDDA